MKVRLTKGQSFTGSDGKKFEKGLWYEVADEYGLYLVNTGMFDIPKPGENPDLGGTPAGHVPDGIISMIGDGKDAVVGTVPQNTGDDLTCPICKKKFKNKSGLKGHIARKHEKKGSK